MMRLFIKLKNRVGSYARITLVKCVGLFRSHSPEKSVMIFGEPRSGSTWLMELLARNGKFIPVWEPTHPTLGVNPLPFHGEPRIFEYPLKANTLLQRHFADILTLKKVNKWILKFTSLKSILYGNSTLIKLVHGTLLLPWIINHIALNFKPVYIFRHPIAVALSQMNHGMNIEREMMSESTFQRVYAAEYEKYRKYFLDLRSPLEKQVAMWCLHNKYFLTNANIDKLILIYYEDLLINPLVELKRLSAEWNINLDVDARFVRKASKTDFQKRLKKNPIKQLSKWQVQISSADRDKIQQILDYFEINVYSASDPLPVKINNLRVAT